MEKFWSTYAVESVEVTTIVWLQQPPSKLLSVITVEAERAAGGEGGVGIEGEGEARRQDITFHDFGFYSLDV